jgi:hypothetical protein
MVNTNQMTGLVRTRVWDIVVLGNFPIQHMHQRSISRAVVVGARCEGHICCDRDVKVDIGEDIDTCVLPEAIPSCFGERSLAALRLRALK